MATLSGKRKLGAKGDPGGVSLKWRTMRRNAYNTPIETCNLFETTKCVKLRIELGLFRKHRGELALEENDAMVGLIWAAPLTQIQKKRASPAWHAQSVSGEL